MIYHVTVFELKLGFGFRLLYKSATKLRRVINFCRFNYELVYI